MQRFATSKPAEAAIPTADLAAVKGSKCVFVDLRAPMAQASTGARQCRPAWSLVSQLLTSAGACDLKNAHLAVLASGSVQLLRLPCDASGCAGL